MSTSILEFEFSPSNAELQKFIFSQFSYELIRMFSNVNSDVVKNKT